MRMQPDPTNERFEATVRSAFAGQPFMATIGASLASVQPGVVEIAVPFDAELMQQAASCTRV